MTAPTPTRLPEAEWRAREAAHQERADAFTSGWRERAGTAVTHPVDDFLFTYYPLRPGLLRRWHPGAGVVLEGASEEARASWKWYVSEGGPDARAASSATPTPTALSVDAAAFAAANERSIRFIVSLLLATAARPANLACFGLHEWAMVYRADEPGGQTEGALPAPTQPSATQPGAQPATQPAAKPPTQPSATQPAATHPGAQPATQPSATTNKPATQHPTGAGRRHDVPLRLGQAATDAVVEAPRISCSHFDAFRFFTPDAIPLNRLQPTRESQPQLEQPGCLHAGMDVYKWATKLGPIVPGELLLDCFELARDIRQLDMRASPYDLGEWGYAPVPIETAEGKAFYAREQRGFAERGNVLRERLVAAAALALDAAADPAPAPTHGAPTHSAPSPAL